MYGHGVIYYLPYTLSDKLYTVYLSQTDIKNLRLCPALFERLTTIAMRLAY